MPGPQSQDPTLDLFGADGQPPSGAPGGLTFDGESISLADFAERAYLEYAVSVVKGRA